MSDDVVEKTRKTAALYFNGVEEETPYELWRAFDSTMSRDLSLFITGRMYSREKIPHTTRQMVTIAALTALGQPEELKLHIFAALNVGCAPGDIAEAIFQTGVYAGVPAMNAGLKTLRDALEQKGLWPLQSQA